jgi:hypothetical protein
MQMAGKRKKYFVDRSVQGAILLRLVMHWTMFVIVAGTFLYFVEMIVSPPGEAGRNVVSRHGPTVLAVVVLAPIFLRDLCKLTNRFAGPMVRLQRAMRDLAEGRDVPAFHFRDGDYWQQLAIDFNQIATRMQRLSQGEPSTSGMPEAQQPPAARFESDLEMTGSKESSASFAHPILADGKTERGNV